MPSNLIPTRQSSLTPTVGVGASALVTDRRTSRALTSLQGHTVVGIECGAANEGCSIQSD